MDTQFRKDDSMKIIEELKGMKTVGITGHVRPDGDCIGSTLGLYNYLTENMPELTVELYLETPGSEFGYLTNIDKIQTESAMVKAKDKVLDCFIILDCSSLDRIEPFAELFKNAKKTICIDHHVSNQDFADMNLVEPQASSTCEVLYSVLDSDKISKAVAECIYTGIIHDTGVFKYSCTSAKTMEIAGRMMEMGIDYSDIIDNSFYKKTYIQNQILGRALLESVRFFDGKCIFSSVTKEEMAFYGVTGRELNGIIEQLRLTEGVEVAIFLYQSGEDEYKVSLRSKKVIDVSAIALHFGGGGHVRAAGFTGCGTVYDIINSIGAMIEEQFKAANIE
jgi:phosphoesterase RecJ-like protein